jgi:hypothetical protein
LPDGVTLHQKTTQNSEDLFWKDFFKLKDEWRQIEFDRIAIIWRDQRCHSHEQADCVPITSRQGISVYFSCPAGLTPVLQSLIISDLVFMDQAFYRNMGKKRIPGLPIASATIVPYGHWRRQSLSNSVNPPKFQGSLFKLSSLCGFTRALQFALLRVLHGFA